MSEAFHSAFEVARAGDAAALLPYLADPAHESRIRVYQNNVVTAWADAIVDGYPTVARLVGEDFMRAMALAFVRSHPPQSPVLALYGEGFPRFVESFEAARTLPYLADVARLDRAWLEALFAENLPPLSADDMSALSDDRIAGLAPGLHPSVRLASAGCNALEIWRANRSDASPEKIALRIIPSFAAVWWGGKGATPRSLTSEEFEFLTRIGAGANIGEAAAAFADGATAVSFFTTCLTLGLFKRPNEGLPS